MSEPKGSLVPKSKALILGSREVNLALKQGERPVCFVVNTHSPNDFLLLHTLCPSLQDHYVISKQIDECEGVRLSARFISKDWFR